MGNALSRSTTAPLDESASRARIGSGASIEVAEKSVTKRQPRDQSVVERIRTQAAFDLALESGLFSVPRMLSFDDAAGTIRFERLENMRPVKEYLARTGPTDPMLSRIARALAAIHDRLESPIGSAGKPEWLDAPTSSKPVHFHGDFGLGNIMCNPISGEIAILDWAPAEWIDFRQTRGPAEVELSNFLISLFMTRPFGPEQIRRPTRRAHEFLATYQAERGIELQLGALRDVHLAMDERYFQAMIDREGFARAIAYRPHQLWLRRFLARLSRVGL